MKAEVGYGMQLISKKTSPLFASIKQVAKNNEVIKVTGAVLGGKVWQPPDQANVGGEEKYIVKEPTLD